MLNCIQTKQYNLTLISKSEEIPYAKLLLVYLLKLLDSYFKRDYTFFGNTT